MVLAGNTCQVDATAMVVSGILWKCSLVEEGRETILAKNGVDTLLKLVQQFLGSVIVCRNAVGCLALLCTHSEPPRARGDPLDSSVCELVRRRLGISLVFDAAERFAGNPQFCIQMISLLQSLLQGVAVSGE